MFSFGGWLRGRLVPLCWLRGDVFVLVDFLFFLRQFDRNQSVTDPMWTDGKREQTRTK